VPIPIHPRHFLGVTKRRCGKVTPGSNECTRSKTSRKHLVRQATGYEPETGLLLGRVGSVDAVRVARIIRVIAKGHRPVLDPRGPRTRNNGIEGVHLAILIARGNSASERKFVSREGPVCAPVELPIRVDVSLLLRIEIPQTHRETDGIALDIREMLV